MNDKKPYHISESLGILFAGVVAGGIIWALIFMGMAIGYKIGFITEKPLFDSFWLLTWPVVGAAWALVHISNGKPDD